MLLFPTVLITSLATVGGWRLADPEAPSQAATKTPASARVESRQDQAVRLLPPATVVGVQGCNPTSMGSAAVGAALRSLPCPMVVLAPAVVPRSLVWHTASSGSSNQATGSPLLSKAQVGFLHLDLFATHLFGAGPEVSWIMPDAPHENLLRQRLVTPG